MISVIAYLYNGGRGYGPQHANTVFSMLKRHLTIPFQFWIVGDNPKGLDPEIKFYPCRQELIPLDGVMVALDIWRRDAGDVFGPRLMVIDLDVIIMNNIDQLALRKEPVLIWEDRLRGRAKGFVYNSSFFMLDAGCRPDVWETFNPLVSPGLMRSEGWFGKGKKGGSDQAWISRCLGNDVTTVGPKDGIYSFKFDIRGKGMPANPKMIFFHGPDVKPWKPHMFNEHKWIRENYR